MEKYSVPFKNVSDDLLSKGFYCIRGYVMCSNAGLAVWKALLWQLNCFQSTFLFDLTSSVWFFSTSQGLFFHLNVEIDQEYFSCDCSP
jgi:hypothetical protein